MTSKRRAAILALTLTMLGTACTESERSAAPPPPTATSTTAPDPEPEPDPVEDIREEISTDDLEEMGLQNVREEYPVLNEADDDMILDTMKYGCSQLERHTMMEVMQEIYADSDGDMIIAETMAYVTGVGIQVYCPHLAWKLETP